MNKSEPLVSMDSSRILEGRLKEVKTAIKELVEFVEANEPRPLAYNVYFSEDGSQMTVIQVHSDSASMEFHMKIAGPMFLKFKDLLKLSEMHIYGGPSDALLQQMQQKAKMLGETIVALHEHHADFTRLGVSWHHAFDSLVGSGYPYPRSSLIWS